MFLLSMLAGATEPPQMISRLDSDGVFIVELPEPVSRETLSRHYDRWLERAAGMSPDEASAVRLEGRLRPGDPAVPLLDLLPELPPVPEKEAPAASAPFDNPGATDGILAGKAVYISQCHGWTWIGSFATQRDEVHQTVEDFHNPEGTHQYLIAYLENAGASVYTVKERDHQTQMAIADNDGVDYAETGSGFEDFELGFGPAATYAYGVDPFNSGTTRRFPADGGAVATWTPAVPSDGWYAVYVSWDSDSANASDAHYRITHPGGVIDRYYDQRVHGSTWQYTERLWLTAGSSLTVELVGDSTQSGAWLSADAVRIGGGMGQITRGGVTTNRPKWEGDGIKGAQLNGAPTSVYDPNGNGDGSDPSSRSRWAAWEHPAGEPAVYLSWHSNASEFGTARGTSTYYAGGGADSPDAALCSSAAPTGTYTLANAVQTHLIDQFQTNWESTWQDRGVRESCFAEVNTSYNDEMPAILVELAFHDEAQDAAHLKEPLFRRDASRAMANGIIDYFASEDGVAAVYLPEPPVAVEARHAPGGIRIAWQPGPSGGTDGDPAVSYRVHQSTDGRSWDAGFPVSGTNVVLTPNNSAWFWRVVAVNEAGQSFPSEIVGARLSPDGSAPVLVVGAFDRLDLGLLGTETVPNLGTVRRLDVMAMNGADIVVPHGRAIASAGWFFDSTTDEALGSIPLDDYSVVVWAAGQDSTVEESFSDAQQGILRDYVDAGGKLIASGSEVLWDLDERGSASDQAFAADVLGASLLTDAAASTDVDGEDLLQGLTLDFGDGRYDVRFPDVLDSSGTPIAYYGGTELAGVLTDQGAFFGFPLDVVEDPAELSTLFLRLLETLDPAVDPPDVPDPPVDPPDDPPDPPDDPTDPPDDPSNPTPGDGLVPGDPSTSPGRVASSELGGCGCQSLSSSGLLAWPILLLALSRRR